MVTLRICSLMIPTRHKIYYLSVELLFLSFDMPNSTCAFRISQNSFTLFGVEHLSSENLSFSPQSNYQICPNNFPGNKPTDSACCKALALPTEFKLMDSQSKSEVGGEFIGWRICLKPHAVGEKPMAKLLCVLRNDATCQAKSVSPPLGHHFLYYKEEKWRRLFPSNRVPI